MMDAFRIGVVIKTHGLKGEVKVFPTTGEPKWRTKSLFAQVSCGSRSYSKSVRLRLYSS